MFRELVEATRKPVVAHGVGFSVGGASSDAARRASWLERIRADHEVFRFGWYTEHLGVSALGGLATTLPLPTPMTDAAVMRTRSALDALQRIVPDVGVENSVFYFHLGDPLDEPAFLGRIVDGPGRHLLLDLHNVYTTALNAGFDPRAYVARLPLRRPSSRSTCRVAARAQPRGLPADARCGWTAMTPRSRSRSGRCSTRCGRAARTCAA